MGFKTKENNMDAETTFYQDYDSNIAHSSANYFVNAKRLKKFADKFDLPMVEDDDYVNVDVDMDKFNISYTNKGISISRKPVMSEEQRIAASERLAELRKSQLE